MAIDITFDPLKQLPGRKTRKRLPPRAQKHPMHHLLPDYQTYFRNRSGKLPPERLLPPELQANHGGKTPPEHETLTEYFLQLLLQQHLLGLEPPTEDQQMEHCIKLLRTASPTIYHCRFSDSNHSLARLVRTYLETLPLPWADLYERAYYGDLVFYWYATATYSETPPLTLPPLYDLETHLNSLKPYKYLFSRKTIQRSKSRTEAYCAERKNIEDQIAKLQFKLDKLVNNFNSQPPLPMLYTSKNIFESLQAQITPHSPRD